MNKKRQPQDEYFVNVTMRIPSRMLNRLTKKAIASKDVQILCVDWENAREVWKA